MLGTEFCVKSLKKSNEKTFPLSTPCGAFCKLRAVKHFKAVLRQPYLPHKAFIGKYLLADIVILQAEFSVPSQSKQHLTYLMYHLDSSQPDS